MAYLKVVEERRAGWMLIILAVVMTVLLGMAGIACAAGEQLLHNSDSFPGSAKWPTGQSGDAVDGWGLPDTQYGEITCKTCHDRNTGNIKRVKKLITVTDPVSPDAFPVEADDPTLEVEFLTAEDGSSHFGNDSDAYRDSALGRDKSNRICEVCHSQNKYHNYSTNAAAQTAKDHYNDYDCIQCHQHNAGFRASCASCHDANSSLADSHGVHYNTTTVATGHFTTNTSTQTEYIFQCGNCHDDVGSSAVTHINGEADPGVRAAEVAFSGSGTYSPDTVEASGSPDVGPNGTFRFTAGSCGTNDCHNDGTAAKGAPNKSGAGNLNWSVTTLDCGGCHDAEPGTTRGSARHTAHIDNSTYNFNCAECHHDTTLNGTTIADKSKHVNQSRDVVYNSLNSDGSAYTNDTTPCSNIYCHSDGQKTSAPYTAPLSAVQWSSSPGTWDCASCHDNAKDNTTLSGAHEAHVYNSATAGANLGRDLACDQCHDATVDGSTTIADYSLHVNSSKDILVKIANSSCNSIACHSDGNADSDTGTGGQGVTYNNPDWLTGSLDCDGCHGGEVADGNAYPDYASNPTGGDHNSHSEHMALTGVTCKNCHRDTSTAGDSIDGADPAQHVDQTVDVVFNSIGGLTGTWDDGTKSCSTTYCHDSGTPTWGGAVNCGECHAADKSLPPSHATHYNSGNLGSRTAAKTDEGTGAYVYQCDSCHDGVPHADGSKDIALNATWDENGATANWDGGTDTCSATYCHSDGNGGAGVVNPVWNSTVMGCGSCHLAEPTTGKHTTHVADGTYNFNCADCHAVTTGDGSTIADKYEHIDKEKDVNVAATYNGGSFSFTQGADTCANLYCHSDGKAAWTGVSVNWGASISTCDACHDNAGTTSNLSGSHLAHIGTDATDTNKQFGFDCDACHAATVSGSDTISDYAQHVDTERDVAVNTLYNGTGGIDGDYNAVTVGGCATTDCHGSASPLWADGATTLGNCSACHGMEASATDDRDTNGDVGDNTDPQVGMHEAHLTAAKGWSEAITCDECHKTTVDNMTAQTTYVGKVNAAGHIDSALPAELVFGTRANYNSASPTYSGAPGGTCATTYCHDGGVIGKGWSGTLNTPDWNTPYFTGTTVDDCGFCHGYPPAAPHANDTDCDACHTNTNATNDGFTDVSLHINGTVEAEGGTDCLDCHGSGRYMDPVASNPTHSDHTDVTGFLTGLSLDTNDFGKVSKGWYDVTYNASGRPVIGCGQCHPADASKHRDAVVGIEVELYHADPANVGDPESAGIPATNAKRHNLATAQFSGNKCSGIYCHSDGVLDGAFADTQDWDTGAITDCNGCHGNGPDTGTHDYHVVGIHYDTLYDDDGVGLMPDAAASDAAHGDSTTADTISCQTCHNDTVAVNGNGTMINATMTIGGVASTGCSECHTAGGGNPGDGAPAIKANSTVHINGAKDIVFAVDGFKSKAQLRDDIETLATTAGAAWERNDADGDSAAKPDSDDYKNANGNSFDIGAALSSPNYNGATCSNINCHNGIETPVWSDGFQYDCRSCHTSVPK